MKKYLMSFAAALTVGVAATSCSTDSVYEGVSNSDLVQNAEQKLGIEIDPNQTWVMTSEGQAKVTVNGDYGETYTVNIYQNNPFVNNTGILLATGSVKSGGTMTASFTYPTASTTLYATLVDAKGYSYVKPTAIIDGVMETTFGGETRTRSLNGDEADDFVIPTYTQPAVAQYLENAREVNSYNAANDYSLSSLTDEEQAQVPEEDKIQMQGWVKVSQKKLKLTHDWTGNISALGLTNASEDNLNARTLYIENATWTMPDDGWLQVGQGTVIVVGAGGKIVIPTRATIKFTGNSTYNCQLIVLPTGEISGGGTLEFSNGSLSGKYDYNAGTIDVGTLNNNGGELYNAGTIKATVLKGGAGKSTYINAGKVYITRSDYGSGSSNTRILNNCWWDVKENLFARNIVQGEGAYIHVGTNFEMSCGNDGTDEPSYYYAKANSLLDVEGAAGFNNIDVVGPTSDYAYMQFGYIEGAWSTHGLHTATNYTGWPDITCGAIINNIRLSVDNNQSDAACQKVINEMLNGTAGQGKKIGNGNAVLVQKGQYTAATVEESECSPGITIVPPTVIVNNNPIYTYAFEDETPAGDYDLNDVVLQIRVNNSDSTKLDITIAALGGIRDVTMTLNGIRIKDSSNNEELHTIMGVNAGTMTNTGYATAAPKTLTVSLADYNLTKDDVASLPIKIQPAGMPEVGIATQGQDPHGVVIPNEWVWPRERVCIKDAYPNFIQFALDASTTDNAVKGWYNKQYDDDGNQVNPIDSKLYYTE